MRFKVGSKNKNKIKMELDIRNTKWDIATISATLYKWVTLFFPFPLSIEICNKPNAQTKAKHSEKGHKYIHTHSCLHDLQPKKKRKTRPFCELP